MVVRVYRSECHERHEPRTFEVLEAVLKPVPTNLSTTLTTPPSVSIPISANVQFARLMTVFLALVSLVLTSISFSSTALAADTTVSLESNANGLTVRGDRAVRFYVDYASLTVILPSAAAAPGPELPEGIKLETRDDGLILHFSKPFTLSLSSDGKTLSIVLQAPSNGKVSGNDERVPTFYYLTSANPTQVAALLVRLYPNLRVEVDERQRAIVVLINPADKPVIEALIKQFDVARPQVMFEAEIIEVNRTLSQQLGIDYSKLINLNFKLIEGAPPAGNLLGFGQFTRAPLSLEVGLQLLKNTGASRTLAKPRVATLDGLEARLNATQTQPIKTVGQGGQVSVSNITTGINLRFLPKVGPDGSIESQLSIAVSSPTGFTSEGLPAYSTREANTTVRVRNGEPIVIGGLLETRRSTSSQGVPGLMDIPIVGELFKTSYVEERDTDLIILVTPYIVSNGAASNTATPNAPAATATPAPVNGQAGTVGTQPAAPEKPLPAQPTTAPAGTPVSTTPEIPGNLSEPQRQTEPQKPTTTDDPAAPLMPTVPVGENPGGP
jgi:general secretion pathway protein D